LHGKVPLAGSRGFEDATVEEEHVERWWRQRPSANIGLATGGASGLYVIDADGEAGRAEWCRLLRAHGELLTRVAVTGGGGWHIYLRLPRGVELRNFSKRSRVLGEHIDGRGSGGYVLLPPSRHPETGHRYRWLGDEPAKPMPGWLLARIQPPGSFRSQRSTRTATRPSLSVTTTAYGRAILRRCLEYVIEARVGERNERLNCAAWTVGRWVGAQEIDPRGVDTLLLAASTDPDRRKAADTIRRALRAGVSSPAERRRR
jgi:hypothetical protein